MRKTVIGILILTLLCSLVPMSAFASPVPRGWDDGIMPLYVAFTHTYCDMSVSGTTATCRAGGGGASSDVDYITVDMSLWSGPIGSTTYPNPEETWSTYTSSAPSGGTSKTATVSSSKDYQLFATIKAYKDGQLVDIDYKTDYYLN